MSDLTADDYYALLHGKNRGKHYMSNYYIVKRKNKENPTQTEILLDEHVGLPTNLNPEYRQRIVDKKKKKRKVDAQFLQTLRT